MGPFFAKGLMIIDHHLPPPLTQQKPSQDEAGGDARHVDSAQITITGPRANSHLRAAQVDGSTHPHRPSRRERGKS
jgi:hypothetical protein